MTGGWLRSELPRCRCRAAGALPDAWGDAHSFPALEYLSLEANMVNSSLPSSWAAPTAFAQVGAHSGLDDCLHCWRLI